MEQSKNSVRFAHIVGETQTSFYTRESEKAPIIVVSFEYFKFYEVHYETEKYVYLFIDEKRAHSFAFHKSKVSFILEEIPEGLRNSVFMEVQHIFDSGANELRILEMVERMLKKPLDMLAEIEAWLSMNTEPTREQTAALRASIQKLLNGG